MAEAPAILVVDDDADNRRIAGAALRSAGWRVDDVADGESAIEKMRQGDYSLVLLDIQMPGLDGYETAMAARTSGFTVPIVAFTASRHPDTLDRARAAGMDGHIGKPFSPAGLIEAVRPWWPEADHVVRRLGEIFGEAEIAGFLRRLHEQLVDVLEIEGGNEQLRREAHKIAGLAGTLGFADLSRYWLAVSEGDDAAMPAARIATRKAMTRLARHSSNTQDDQAVIET